MIDIYKLVNVPTSLNYLKTKVDDSDIGKLKTIPVEFKKFSDVVDNEVVKNTKFKLLKTKVNKLNKKIPDVTTLIHINQYYTDKQNLEKKIGYSDKKIRDVSELVTTTVFNTKIKEGDNKIPDLSGLVKKTISSNYFARNVIIFGVDNSSSSQTVNQKNDFNDIK